MSSILSKTPAQYLASYPRPCHSHDQLVLAALIFKQDQLFTISLPKSNDSLWLPSQTVDLSSSRGQENLDTHVARLVAEWTGMTAGDTRYDVVPVLEASCRCPLDRVPESEEERVATIPTMLVRVNVELTSSSSSGPQPQLLKCIQDQGYQHRWIERTILKDSRSMLGPVTKYVIEQAFVGPEEHSQTPVSNTRPGAQSVLGWVQGVEPPQPCFACGSYEHPQMECSLMRGASVIEKESQQAAGEVNEAGEDSTRKKIVSQAQPAASKAPCPICAQTHPEGINCPHTEMLLRCPACGDEDHEIDKCDARRCYDCGTFGHESRQCQSGRKKWIRDRCRNCWEEGHNVIDCQLPYRPSVQRWYENRSINEVRKSS